MPGPREIAAIPLMCALRRLEVRYDSWRPQRRGAGQ